MFIVKKTIISNKHTHTHTHTQARSIPLLVFTSPMGQLKVVDNTYMCFHVLMFCPFNNSIPSAVINMFVEQNVHTCTWKKHVYSILAKERRRERTSSTHKTQKTQHTKRKNKKAGPWVPSLENWGGRLKSLLHVSILSQSTVRL